MHLTRIDLEEPVEVALALEEREVGVMLVRPQQELTDGGRYRLSVEGEGDCATTPVEFEAVAAAPLPETLGRATAPAPKRGKVSVLGMAGYGCRSLVPAVSIDPGIDFSDEAEPWAPLFEYQVQVDGEEWPADHAVFAQCNGPERADTLSGGTPIYDGAVEGSHRLRWTATLPGVEGVLTSDETRFALHCDEPPADGSEGPPGDRTDPDAAPEPMSSASDCAAAAAGTRGARHAGGWTVTLLAALLLLRRRRG